ncbi:integrase, catalytic region, zinc finger, CCHC-type containing protein [Tanacetum coccineum]
MTGQHDKLINFVSKFFGTIRFGNEHFVAFMGYGDLQIGNILILRVYYVEGLCHNLFSIRQFFDSDIEVAFRKHTCFVRNLEGVDLLLGSCGSNLYTISMEEMMKSSPICLLSKALKTKSYTEYVGITRQTSVARTPQQYDVIERRNRTLVELPTTNSGATLSPPNIAGASSSTSIAQDAPSLSTSLTTETTTPIQSTNVEQPNNEDEDADFDSDTFTNPFAPPVTSSAESSSRIVDTSNMYTFQQPHSHIRRWTKDHPLVTIIGNPSKLVSIRHQLATNAMWCYFHAFLTKVEPDNYKEAMKESCWIEAMQEEIHETFKNEATDIASTNPSLCDEFGNEMRKCFEMSMMGKMSFFLGLQISQNPRGIFINQSKYALEMLKKYSLEQYDVVNTPMVERSKLDDDLKGIQVDPTRYRSKALPITPNSGLNGLSVLARNPSIRVQWCPELGVFW